jgi:inner membrane protein
MPTIMTHAIIPLCLGLALGPARLPKRVVVAGCLLAMLPDADVIGFRLGIAYADALGHRGASHALSMALIVGLIMTVMLRPPRAGIAAAFLVVAMASHGLLDALTSGGLGPALFWPFSEARIFAPYTPIRVSPIGLDFFGGRAIAVLKSEFLWVWLPTLLTALAVRLLLIARADPAPPAMLRRW